ncbi:hypothetical protein K491DRAFT_598030 [Lophiostoma macrostomum CBS 122681]|uniref:Uncharacterized protein n=1 Tax=Lophiostoma macrostomum CBS 122681 TaxID=1314788 RepID=A0A6A6TAE0_9PLEO|nr:hypothetical protein K491DRAFT_598030 [Lophiostoma macrostomum CBS 122681]
MAEVLAGVASVIAVVQLADKVAQYCKYYIDGVRDAPTDLRVILMEMNTLKPIFEHLSFLCESRSQVTTMISGLAQTEGPIEGCKKCVKELEGLLRSDLPQNPSQSKRRKVEATLAPLAWPFKEKRAKKLLEELSRYKTTINLALTTETTKNVETIKNELDEINGKLAQAQRQDVYRWLEHTDPSSLHHRACQLYEPGTGNWLLRAPTWSSWIDLKHRCLWVHRIPGAGKTVLMSHLIEHLKSHTRNATISKPESTIAYAYYYCYFAHRQDEADPFLRSILNQLCRRSDQITDKTYVMYKIGGKPSTSDLPDALGEVLQAFDIVYVAIDAVDESNPREQLLQLFGRLLTELRFAKIQLLVSSREYSDIERAMRAISTAISMANPYAEEDIRCHVRSLMQRNARFENWSQDMLEEVTSTISTQARGMFRWAACQIDALQRVKCERAVIQRRLQDLPKTLDETYDRIFTEVQEDERLFVYHVIHWIVFHEDLFREFSTQVRLPCSILIEAAVRSVVRENAHYGDRFYDTQVLQDLCGCLIQTHVDPVTPSSRYVVLAHHTVREYLFSLRFSSSPLGLSLVSGSPLRDAFTQMALGVIFDLGYTTRFHKSQKWSSLDVYLSILMLLRLRKDSASVVRHGTLGPRAVKLFDSSQTHFIALATIISTFSTYKFGVEAWAVEWLSPVPDTSVRQFWAILQFDASLSDRSFLLTREFLKR